MNERQCKPRFQGETVIVIQGRRTQDIARLLLASAWTAFVAWAATSMLLETPESDQGLAGFLLLTVPAFAWALVGSISRLRNSRPFLKADHTGLRLHPSVAPTPLPWTQIRSLSIQTEPGERGFGGRLRVQLNDPVRSLDFPFGAHEIRLRLRDLDLSYKAAADLLRQLKRLRRVETEDQVS